MIRGIKLIIFLFPNFALSQIPDHDCLIFSILDKETGQLVIAAPEDTVPKLNTSWKWSCIKASLKNFDVFVWNNPIELNESWLNDGPDKDYGMYFDHIMGFPPSNSSKDRILFFLDSGFVFYHFYGLSMPLPQEKKIVNILIAHNEDTMRISLSGLDHPMCCRRYILDSIPFTPGTFNIDCVPVLKKRYGDCGKILPNGYFELETNKCILNFPRYLNITPEEWSGLK